MNGPFNRADLTNAAKALFELNANKQRIDALERADADVAELRARNDHAAGVFEAILAEYGDKKG